MYGNFLLFLQSHLLLTNSNYQNTNQGFCKVLISWNVTKPNKIADVTHLLQIIE